MTLNATGTTGTPLNEQFLLRSFSGPMSGWRVVPIQRNQHSHETPDLLENLFFGGAPQFVLDPYIRTTREQNHHGPDACIETNDP
ncbi:hypothetical protein RRSWK_01341 [Rhodopirellula sp. SWK7]|nr:hypothetical protein RRSWK_01341 [Rhodopirellula sp. SWK7]